MCCVSAVDIKYNEVHYQIPTSPLPDLAPYTGNYTTKGDYASFTAHFFDKDGNQTLNKFVNVTDSRRSTEDGYITAPTKLGYLIIILDTGVYDRSGTKWVHIDQRCPGNTANGEEKAFWFDPDHPINSTFIVSKATKESRFGGVEHFKLMNTNVTIETFPKK